MHTHTHRTVATYTHTQTLRLQHLLRTDRTNGTATKHYKPPDNRSCLLHRLHGDQRAELGIKVQMPHYLRERTEAAQCLEVGERDRHLGLMVVVVVYIGTLRVQTLSQLLVWVGLGMCT